MSTTRQGASTLDIEQNITQRVVDAMAAYEANKNNGNGSHNEISGDTRSVEHTVRNCSYKEFLNCKPYDFRGIEGAIGLTRWFEKMESIFHISNCAENCHMKFAACTLLDGALTWWNSFMKKIGLDASYETTWKELKKMMIDKYCPRKEIQKMETKLWNLSVQGTNIAGYTRRF
ncbi:reverse transcriptase domain-containing protein [Tanacetum coccineum]